MKVPKVPKMPKIKSKGNDQNRLDCDLNGRIEAAAIRPQQLLLS
jgi:hypothetical protein